MMLRYHTKSWWKMSHVLPLHPHPYRLIGLPSFPPASSAGTPSRAGLAPDLRYDERATGSYGILRNQHMKNGEINGKHGELE